MTHQATQVGPYKVPAGVIVFPCLYSILMYSGNWEQAHQVGGCLRFVCVFVFWGGGKLLLGLLWQQWLGSQATFPSLCSIPMNSSHWQKPQAGGEHEGRARHFVRPDCAAASSCSTSGVSATNEGPVLFLAAAGCYCWCVGG